MDQWRGWLLLVLSLPFVIRSLNGQERQTAPIPTQAPFVSVFARRSCLGDYSHLLTVLQGRLADGCQAEIQERMI